MHGETVKFTVFVWLTETLLTSFNRFWYSSSFGVLHCSRLPSSAVPSCSSSSHFSSYSICIVWQSNHAPAFRSVLSRFSCIWPSLTSHWCSSRHAQRRAVTPVYCVMRRVQLKCDGTRWRTVGEVKGKLANGVGSQYSSHYLGTWCIQHYYRWCTHLGCQ